MSAPSSRCEAVGLQTASRQNALMMDSGDSAAGLGSDALRRAQRGDEDALEQLIRHYQERVARRVVAVIGRDSEWQDLCQRIFVKLVLGLPRLKNLEVLEPWLMRIARNECYDYLRRRRAQPLFTPWERAHDAIAAPAMESSNLQARLAALDEAIERLPADQRELVLLMRTRAYSYEALAAHTGATLAAIKSRLFRARRKLRRLLSADSEEPLKFEAIHHD